MDSREIEEFSRTRELRVFPETGHQYFTIPLAVLCPASKEEELNSIIAKHSEEPWRVWGSYQYVRYRYVASEDTGSVAMIKIAVETNMGPSDDGLLFDIKEDLDADGPEDVDLPYAADHKDRVEDVLGADRSISLGILPTPKMPGKIIVINLNIVFRKPQGSDPVDVDLVVDLGNTRTAGLLLESRAASEREIFPFSKRVMVLRVTPPGGQYDKPDDKDCEIFPSWLLMHRTTFAATEPPLSEELLFSKFEKYTDAHGVTKYRRSQYLPRSFVELSPAAIGGGWSRDGIAQRFANLHLTAGRYYFSSPKRYFWDDSPTGSLGAVFWSQVKGRTDPDLSKGGETTELGGVIRMYMDPDGADRDIDNPPAEDAAIGNYAKRSPTYPRRDTLCWFALSLIETAHRQINSSKYLALTGFGELPRRLRKILVTYPAAWNHEAKSAYLNQWQRAINLFTGTHFPQSEHREIDAGGSRPMLVDAKVNEAICSQLPILYSDIRTLLDHPREWFRLYGSSGEDDQGSAVVMNLDIGGGTTDLTVIRYQGSAKGSISPTLLFQDGKSTAGDELVRKVIEQILLPAWIRAGDKGQYRMVPEAKKWVLLLLSNPSSREILNIDPLAENRLARLTRLLLIPLVNRLLSGMGTLEHTLGTKLEPLDMDSFGNRFGEQIMELNRIACDVIRELCPNGSRWKGEVFPKNVQLTVLPSEIDKCVDEVFGEFCKSLGRVAGTFNCDLVVVTGKPTELPRLRQLIRETFPLLPQRIIHARNFPAGAWYPFASTGLDGAKKGRIMDAKSCTVVGAALYLDSLVNPHLNRFLHFENSAESDKTEVNLRGAFFWGVIPVQGHSREFYNPAHILFQPADYSTASRDNQGLYVDKVFDLKINACRIGRQLIQVDNVLPEPVYELCVVPRKGREAGLRAPFLARVTLRWRLEPGSGESLNLLDVVLLEPVENLKDLEVKLRLNTLYENTFWLDNPRFEIDEKKC